MNEPAITVYIPCHNYGQYLEQALESVLAQSRTDWELLIIDEGSTDHTAEIAANFAKAHPDRTRVVTHAEPLGLQACANEAARLARGRYLVRLDADDWFDESAFLVLATHLDDHPDVSLVFPNYFYVDEKGQILGAEQRKKVGKEAEVLDLPAHGACTMVRKSVLEEVGGYDERHDRQDGHELWLKVITRHKVANVSTPLFYYRQHGRSLSGDEERLLEARAKIKRNRVRSMTTGAEPVVVAVVGAKNTYPDMPNVVLSPLAGRPLIDWTIEEALKVEGLARIMVTTDDPRVVEYCSHRWPEIAAVVRETWLSGDRVQEEQVLNATVKKVEELGTKPEIVIWLSVHCPLRKAEHIQKALDTLRVYDVDKVISIYEDVDLHYVHSKKGLEKLNPAMHRQIRVEREALFVDNGAIKVFRARALAGDPADLRVGHVRMPRWASSHIKDTRDAWLAERILEERAAGLRPRGWDLVKTA